MKIGLLGTGGVARTLAAALAERGHAVEMGTRDVAQTRARATPHGAAAPSFADWHKAYPAIGLDTMAEVAARAALVINATAGAVSLEALRLAGTANLRGKTILDVSNPLDFSKGFPPTLTVCNTDSVGEQIQRAFPEARVVKALNTVTANLMVNPGAVAGGEHTLFLCGNDAAAKAEVTELLRGLGWKHLLDLGDITAARGQEMYLALWVRMMGALKSPMLNVRVLN